VSIANFRYIKDRKEGRKGGMRGDNKGKIKKHPPVSRILRGIYYGG